MGWLRELERIGGLLWPGLAQWRDEWRNVIGPDIDESYPAYIGPPPIDVIDRDEAARELSALEKPALLVRIDLKAPDAVIINGFRGALAEARKAHPAPVRNRGRDRLAGRFGPSRFASWRRWRIVELAELLAWREGEWPNDDSRSSKRPSDAQIGRWLGFNDRAGRGFEEAMRALSGALQGIPALWAQVNARSK
jgi:hypothetical protein